MMIAPMGWVVIALGGVVLIAGLALFALMIRRKAIPVTLGLALILIVSAAAWLFLAQGRRVGCRNSLVTNLRTPFAKGIAPFSSQWEVEVNREFDKAREQFREASGFTKDDLKRAEAHRLEAEELAQTHESLVIAEEGHMIVLPAVPSIPPEAIGPATVHLLTKDHLENPWLGRSRIVRGGLVWNLVTALSIAAFLFVGYVFLDASTRGHFTWSLRILSALALVGVFVTMAALRAGL